MEELTGLQQVQIGVLIGGFLLTILAGLFAGARWTIRIESGINDVREDTQRVALAGLAARDENRIDHERIMQNIVSLAAPTSQTHSELHKRIDDLIVRFDRLEQRILTSGGT